MTRRTLLRRLLLLAIAIGIVLLAVRPGGLGAQPLGENGPVPGDGAGLTGG